MFIRANYSQGATIIKIIIIIVIIPEEVINVNGTTTTWEVPVITDRRVPANRLLLLQSALQPLWVLACSTIVEYSQQEGFYRVPLPVARQTPNLEDQ